MKEVIWILNTLLAAGLLTYGLQLWEKHREARARRALLITALYDELESWSPDAILDLTSLAGRGRAIVPEVPQYLTLFPISTTALRHLLDGRTLGSRAADRAFMERLLRLEREVEVYNAVATASLQSHFLDTTRTEADTELLRAVLRRLDHARTEVLIYLTVREKRLRLAPLESTRTSMDEELQLERQRKGTAHVAEARLASAYGSELANRWKNERMGPR